MTPMRPAWRSQLGLLLACTLLLIAAAGGTMAGTDESQAMSAVFWVMFLMGLIVMAYRRFSHLYYIEDDRIEHRTGIIAKNVKSVRLSDLRNVNLDQGVVERLLGIGTLEFSSAGGSGIEVRWLGVKRPTRLKSEVEALRA